jgi:non-specific serine/threonine protein kinase
LQDQGDYDQSMRLHEEVLALQHEIGHPEGMANSLHNMGAVAQDQGDSLKARAFFTESLKIQQVVVDKRQTAATLEAIAELALLDEEGDRAVRLLGYAEALREAIASPIPPNSQADYERVVDIARAQLDETAFAAAWAAGRALTLDQAIAYALEEG